MAKWFGLYKEERFRKEFHPLNRVQKVLAFPNEKGFPKHRLGIQKSWTLSLGHL